MAARYSGNVELRIRIQRMKGWNGKMGWFYVAQVYTPNHSGEAVISPREAGVKGNPRSSEAYDLAAKAILTLANKETRGEVGRQANRLGRTWEIVRVEESPCPLED